jgi:uncharacterized protein YegL
MKKNKTDINLLIDRSGSMAGIWKDTIAGILSFIREQREVPGEANLTIATFDDKYEEVVSGGLMNVADSILDLINPRGGTALLDSMAKVIGSAESRISALDEEERPESVIVVVVTDGDENASKEMTREAIKEMVTKRETGNWKFIFLGANIDAITTAKQYGINAATNFVASAQGASATFNFASAYVGSSRLNND